MLSYKVRVQSRTRAERARFIKLASINAQTALRSRLAHKSTITARYDQLEELLELERPIARMECFDISHTMGERTVASCVVFNREGPLSSEYRRFNIDGITGGDDYAAMEQALERRFGKQQEPDKVPDVLFIDGGLGQLRRAEEILARQLEFLGGKYPLPTRQLHLLQRHLGFQDAGVVDQHIKAAKVLVELGEQLQHLAFISDIRLHGNGLATSLSDFLDQRLRRSFLPVVIQAQCIALSCR